MKKLNKKKVIITGGSGLLGNYFYNKYKKKYTIIKYPYRIEKFDKFKNWHKKIEDLTILSTLHLLQKMKVKNIKIYSI